jgi:hypothetical protein
MKRKIKIFVTTEETGLFSKVRNFFLKRSLKRSLDGLRDLPIEEVEELLIKTFTENGYKATKDDRGTTLRKEPQV